MRSLGREGAPQAVVAWGLSLDLKPSGVCLANQKAGKIISAALACSSKHLLLQEKDFWLGDLDSNQDSQIQSLESYQLDDLPAAGRNTARREALEASAQLLQPF